MTQPNDVRDELLPELKPCPFCGGEAVIDIKGSMRKAMQIACLGCGARMESGDVYGMTDPKNYKWNTRANPIDQTGNAGDLVEAAREFLIDAMADVHQPFTAEDIAPVMVEFAAQVRGDVGALEKTAAWEQHLADWNGSGFAPPEDNLTNRSLFMNGFDAGADFAAAQLAGQRDSVWIVRLGNYYPAEVDSIWSTKELAEQQAAKMSGDWRVAEWTVQAVPQRESTEEKSKGEKL